MRELASLGTSIPGPAFALCMTATLCVKLGNYYGISFRAQAAADEVLAGVSEERWAYYLNERLEHDRVILPKLADEKPRTRWIELISALPIDSAKIDNKLIRDLIRATKNKDAQKVGQIAERAWRKTFQ